MKIMFYINTLNTGGAERVLANLANEFVKNNQEVIFVTSFSTKKEYELSTDIKRINLDNSKKMGRVRKNVCRIRELRKNIKNEQPDILVSFMAEANFRSVLAKLGTGTKCVISVRNDPNREYPGFLGKIVGKILLPLADGCVFQTEDARLWFPRRLQKKSVIIYNAVKKDFFDTARNPVSNLVVTCGRLEKQKNHENLIKAFKEVSKEIKDSMLYIYGEGTERKKLEKLIIDLEMQNKIFLKGVTENVQQALSEADLFVLSSDYEGMPNALLEALAVGVPSVSTDCPCGGPRMLIDDDKDGALVKVGSVDELKSAIINILNNSNIKTQMSKSAKIKANEFRPETIYNEWKNYLKLIIGNSK